MHRIGNMALMDGSIFENQARGMNIHDHSHGQRGDTPPWVGPREPEPVDVSVLGNTVARSDEAKVMLKSISFYTDGHLLDLTASADSGCDLRDQSAIISWRKQKFETMKVEHDDGLPNGLLRINLRLESGRNLAPSDYVLPPPSAPDFPIVREISGAGYTASESGIWIDQKMWVWPAIDESVILVVEWPAFGIEATESILDFGQRD
jgi:hypothetical protein